MKKKIGIVLALILCISLFAMTAVAAEPAASLEGAESVYIADRIEVSFQITADGVLALDGKLEFDKTQLTLIEIIPMAGDSWTVSYNETTGRFFATDEAGFNNPLSGEQILFKAVFQVADLQAGTKISVSCTDLRAAAANEELILSDAVYAATVISGRPASGDCTLAELTVEGGSLSPAFSPEVTTYVVYLPYEAAKANITALANNRYAKVSVDGPEALEINAYTEFKVTCTAESGAAKVYTLNIWRAPEELLHEHTYSMEVVEPSCSAAGYTSYVCDCGDSYQTDVQDPTGHSFGDWETTLEATVEAEGQQLRKCACGAQETRPIAKVSKNADPGKVVLTIVLIIVGVIAGGCIIAGVLYYVNMRRTGKFLQKKKKETTEEE